MPIGIRVIDKISQQSDVAISNIQNADVLAYNSSTQKWENTAISISPAGSQDEIQFNRSSAFSSSVNLKYTETFGMFVKQGSRYANALYIKRFDDDILSFAASPFLMVTDSGSVIFSIDYKGGFSASASSIIYASVAEIPFIVRGNSISSTYDLTQWHNYPGGSIVARIGYDGGVFANYFSGSISASYLASGLIQADLTFESGYNYVFNTSVDMGGNDFNNVGSINSTNVSSQSVSSGLVTASNLSANYASISNPAGGGGTHSNDLLYISNNNISWGGQNYIFVYDDVTNKELFKITSSGVVSFPNTTGTSPFVVASITKVTNLNADLLDGLNSSDFALASHTHTSVQISDSTAVGRSLLTAVDSASVRTVLGLNNVENTALSTWIGSTNLTTLGTIVTGTWNGSVISPVYGGTGITNNAASTLTISGNFATTFTISGITSLTLPTSGTLATLAGSESLTNKKLGSLTSNGFVKTSGGDGTLSVDTNTYLTGNQTITLSGDVSGSGATSIAVTIGNNVVSFAKIQTISTGVLLGRSTAGTGDIEQISVGSGLSLSGGTLTATGGGTGTVTSVSVTTANGVSGSVANATSTPAITLTLGNITPSTVNGLTLTSQTIGFSIAGGTTSKTLTVSNTLTLAGTDSSTLNIGSGGTLGSAAFVATSSFEVPLTFGTGLTRTVNTVTVNAVQNITRLSNLTSNGFVKTSGGDGTLSVDTNTYLTANQTITLSGDVSGSGTTSITATIGSNVVTFAKMQTVSTGVLLGRSTAGTGNVESLSTSNVRTLLSINNVENTALSTWIGSTNLTTLGTITTGTWNATIISPVYGGTGIANNAASTLTISGNFATTFTISGITSVTLPTSGTLATLAGSESLTNKKLGSLTSNGFVKTSGGDGTLSVDTNTYLTSNQTITLSGDVSGSGTTSIAVTIGSGAVTYAKIQNVSANSILGNNSVSSATVTELSSSQVKAMLSLNLVENTALSTWTGSTNLTTLGTIATGTWNATAIADNKITSTLTGKTYNGLTLTSQTIGFSIAGGTTSKTLTVSNTLTLAGIDSSTLNIGSGGTLGSAAFAATSSFEVPLTFGTGLTRTVNTVTVNAVQNITRLSNLTSNGFVKTSGGDGTLSVDTNTYLTGNQTITLSGDVSGSGTTAITATIGSNVVTFAKMQTVSTGVLLGRSTAGTGDIEQISVGSGLSLSGGTLSATGGGTGTVTSVSVTTANGVSGSVANATSTPAITLTLGNITPSTVNGLTLTSQTVGFSIAGGTTSKTLTVSNTLTLAGTDSSTLNIGSGGTLGSAAFAATSSFEVPLTFGTGLTRTVNTVTVNAVQNITRLSNLTSNGFVKTSGGDGTLSVDTNTYLTGNQTITLSGDVSGSGATSITATIGSNVVSFAKMQTISTNRLLGRSTAGTGDIEQISVGSGLSLSGGTLSATGGGGGGVSKAFVVAMAIVL